MKTKFQSKYLAILLLILVVQVSITGCGGGGDGGNGNYKPTNGNAVFDERWESAASGSYSPASGIPLINADEGDWGVHDTVSSSDDCGPTPHRAEIINSNGSKALHLTSGDSMSGCADNIWVAIEEIPAAGINSGFSVPLTRNTTISFDEFGSLVNPQSSLNFCVFKPCGDTVSLMLADNNGNVLAYVMQRASDAQPNDNFSSYREIFLDPDAGSYTRDLFADFRTIPDFQGSGASIKAIVFEVDEHGEATLDNLVIKEFEPPANSGPVQVTEAQLVGIWRRLDPSHTHKGKEYFSDGTGWRGSYSNGLFTRESALTWSLNGVRLIDNRVDGVRVEDIVYFDGSRMTTQRVDNGKYLNWQKQGSGGGAEPKCDLVASTTSNPNEYFQVINQLNSGLTWYFSNAIPFGADMKPSECTLVGLNPGGYAVTFQQCAIADAACTSTFGPTKEVVFSVQNNETYIVEVNSNFFQ